MEGRIDGWMGYNFYFIPPMILLNNTYDNKLHPLIKKNCFKVAQSFYTKSYTHFKFQNLET